MPLYGHLSFILLIEILFIIIIIIIVQIIRINNTVQYRVTNTSFLVLICA